MNLLRHSTRRRPRHRPAAMTIVELLVVTGIILVLAASILVATNSVLNRSRVNGTRAVLQVVNDALEEFRREQSSNPTITRAKLLRFPDGKWHTYADRYGLYPPDELDIFTDRGLPGAEPGFRSLAVGRAQMFPDPGAGGDGYRPMNFFTDPPADPRFEHRDLAAMIVALETFSDGAATILSRIPERHRTAGVLDDKRDPAQFLKRSTGQGWSAGGQDVQIRYIVDSWGVPLSYLAQRDYRDSDSPAIRLAKRSSNSPDNPNWNEASTEIIRLNNNQPLIFSHGPSGRDQLTDEWMEKQPGSSTEKTLGRGRATLMGDWEDDHKINHHLNQDNVYLDPTLNQRLAEGIED